jgi:hypothetical protein
VAEAKISIGAPACLVQLTVGGTSQLWQRLGLDFDDRQACRIGKVTLQLDEGAPPGHFQWAFDPFVSSIDGILPASRVPAGELVSSTYLLIDHVVVMTDSLERTSTALKDFAGLEVRRTRDAGNGVHQAFHRSGEVIVEVVQAPRVTEPHLWGFVLVAPRLDEVVSKLGESVVSVPRDAVQPGRRISTVRREVGLGVNVALISPSQ